MSQISSKREIRIQRFNCPLLNGVATLEFKYLVLDIGKEAKTGANCRQKHLCGIVKDTIVHWELCPKGKELNG